MKMLKMNLTRWIILLISCYTTTTKPVLGINKNFGRNGAIEINWTIKGIDFQSNDKIIVFSPSGIARYNAQGSIDETFGQESTGSVRLRKRLTNDFKMSVKVQQPDNTITTVALKDPVDEETTAECLLKHYDENGLKITKISDALLSWTRKHLTNTTTQIPLARNRILRIHNVAIQSDGKIIVVGETDAHTDSMGFIARYNQDFTLDSTFGPHRTGFIMNAERASFNLVTIHPNDGQIIVAGHKRRSLHDRLRRPGISSDGKASISRYTSDGRFDRSFGTDGKGIRIKSIVAHDNKLIVAYEKNNKIIIEQHNLDATLTRDATFGPNGVGIILSLSPNYNDFSSIALQPNGNIFLITHHRDKSWSQIIALKTLSPEEEEERRLAEVAAKEKRLAEIALKMQAINLEAMVLDQRFGTNGIVRGKIGERFTALIQSNEKLIIARYFSPLNQFEFSYYKNDGSVDETFDTHDATGQGAIVSLAVQQNNHFIATASPTNARLFLFRYNPDWTRDKSLSIRGVTQMEITSMILQPDQKIIVAGKQILSFLTRYNSDGSLDDSFKAPNIQDRKVLALLLQPDGKIVASLTGDDQTGRESRTSLIRYNKDGSHDKTFQEYFCESRKYKSLALQKDTNKIIGATVEDWGNDKSVYNLWRRNPYGTHDKSFRSKAIYIGRTLLTNPTPIVRVLPNGKILLLIGSGVACYNPNGSDDTTFSPNKTHLLPLPDNVQGSDFLFDSDTQTVTIIGEETLPDRTIQPIILRYRSSLSPEEAVEKRRLAMLEEAQLARDQVLERKRVFQLKVQQHADQHSNDCAICLEESAKKPTDAQLSCGHTFHAGCLTGLQNPSCPLCRAPIVPGDIKSLTYREREINQESNNIAKALDQAEEWLAELKDFSAILEAKRLLAADLARVAQSGATVAIAHPEVTQTPAETEPRQHGAAALTPAERRELMRNAAEERLKKEREEAAAAQRAAAVGTTDARGAAAGATAEDRARAAAVVTQETGAAAADPVVDVVAEKIIKEAENGFDWV